MPAVKAKDVEDYIAKATECTRPILIRLRQIFQSASPELQEAIKWGVPCYEHKGPVGGFAAFKSHVTWGLWKASLLNDPEGLIGNGILKGGKIKTVSEVPASAKLIDLIRQAMALNDTGVKATTPEPELPADFTSALKANARARKQFAAFTPARKWQYVNWINKAKRPETRATRIKNAIAKISAGKAMK